MHRDPASFRDPSGHVYLDEGRVFRTISAQAARAFDMLRARGVLDKLVKQGFLLAFADASSENLPDDLSAHDVVRFIEHPKLPFISYPYEWSFELLKAAANFHLDLQLVALELGATLSDATAYNVQFCGPRPVFIDILSLRPYQTGELWHGHRQFCEQFLAPLLLRAACMVSPNAWYRGAQEGISMDEVVRLLPLRWRMRPTVITNLLLPVLAQRTLSREGAVVVKRGSAQRLSSKAFRNILLQLRSFVGGLSAKAAKSFWSGYSDTQTYSASEQALKRGFVAWFCGEFKPSLLWDMGCNTGEFSALALDSGAERAIGFDADLLTLDRAFERAGRRGLDFLPLYADCANPSPDQGWKQQERKGLAARANADALLALAFIHHLVIARNVPLEEAIGWLMSLAPRGVIEFVPIDDPTARTMLIHRERSLFKDYNDEAFESAIMRGGRVIRSQQVSAHGRRLYAYERAD